MRSVTLRIAAAVVFAAGAAAAQGPAAKDAAPAAPTPPEARKVDEYGDLRHCDWSARLDNFAVELQNHPGARGFVVSYDVPGRHSYASRQVTISRYYMVETRGIEGSRLVLVEGGVREDLKTGQTELWLVPEGAAPPVAPPANDRHAPDFSGKFDTFTADPDVYQEVYEMSVPESEVSRTAFAEKLRQQPESVGYVVIRTPAGHLPGAWRRFARRDERLLRGFKVDASRVRTLDGGQAAGREVEVELWVLPPWAPPPASVTEKPEPAFNSAARLHSLDVDTTVDEDAERWMLENLAEFLREHPRATALIVAREPTPPPAADESESAADSGEAAAATAEAPAAGVPDAPKEEEFKTVREVAEKWKKQLAAKYGVGSQRVFVADGRRVPWGAGRLNLWVIPEKGKWPDTQAADEDEAEQQEFYGVAPETEGAATTPR